MATREGLVKGVGAHHIEEDQARVSPHQKQYGGNNDQVLSEVPRRQRVQVPLDTWGVRSPSATRRFQRGLCEFHRTSSSALAWGGGVWPLNEYLTAVTITFRDGIAHMIRTSYYWDAKYGYPQDRGAETGSCPWCQARVSVIADVFEGGSDCDC